MQTLGERIKGLMRDQGWSEGEVARRAGLKQPTVHRIIAGISKDPRPANVEKIARAFGLSSENLRHGGPDGTPSTSYGIDANVGPSPLLEGYAPVITWVQAGAFTSIDNIDISNENSVPKPPGAGPRTFALKVRGQSMAPKYDQGLIIYVDPDVAPYDGDDVVAMMTDQNEATFKQLVQEPGGSQMLKARNPAWPDPWIKINGNCQIVGVVIGALWLRQPR